MKKSLIALAVASAVASPAFAATSNVDIYGILNVAYNRVNDDGAFSNNSNSITSNASRLGFKGTEDLGGGLAAIWQIESGFNVDETNGTNTLGSRNTFVGLKGGFGTVLVGKHDTPMKSMGRMVDNFGDTMADSRNLLGSNAYSKQLFDLRTPNTVAYVSPDFSGLTASVAYVTDWNSNGNSLDNNNKDAYSLTAVYNNGPLMAGLGYEKHDNSTTTTSQNDSIWRLVAGYKIGDAKIGALYEKTKSNYDDVNQRKAWGLFGNYTMGAITFKANYLKVGDYKNSTDSGAKQYTIGADYALSKRTTVYALYGKVSNDSNDGWFSMGIGGGTSDRVDVNNNGNAGDKVSVFGIGVKHSF